MTPGRDYINTGNFYVLITTDYNKNTLYKIYKVNIDFFTVRLTFHNYLKCIFFGGINILDG